MSSTDSQGTPIPGSGPIDIDDLVRRGVRIEYSSGSKYEPIAGYTRAVRYGSQVFVSGTTSPGPTAASQLLASLDVAAKAIKALGGSSRDIVRTRVFVRDESDFGEVTKAHGGFFGGVGVRPVNTTVAGATFVEEAMRIEVEVDAVVGAGREVVRIS